MSCERQLTSRRAAWADDKHTLTGKILKMTPQKSEITRHSTALAIAAATLALWAGASSAAEIAAPSTVVSATLYPSGAAITRAARFEAPAGRHEIVLGDLPLRIDADSIRVSGRSGAGAFTIEGISHRVENGAPVPLPEGERAEILEQLRALSWEREAQRQAITRAAARKAYMAAIRDGTADPGQEAGGARFLDNPDLWASAWAAIEAEAAAADAAAREAEIRIEDIDTEILALERALDQRPPSPPQGVATIAITAAGPIEDGVLEIGYLTWEAGWSPLYDLRLDPAADADGADAPSGDLTMIRRAAVRQNTGEAWEGVAVSLSTARPTERLFAEEPPQSEAALREEIAIARSVMPANENAAGFVGALALSDQAAVAEAPAAPPRALRAAPAPEAGALAQYQGKTVVYALPQPVDAPGDGSVRQVLIDRAEQQVPLSVRATPAVDAAAYLYAEYQNGDAPLLPGRAAIHRDGVYLGALELDYIAPGETASLAFGGYENIVVSRITTRTLEGDEGVFTVSTRRRHRFKLSAENLGDQAMPVTLYDAVPYTETDKIEIDVIANPSPTDRDVEGRRGALAWRFDLAPGAEKTIGFGYDLAWPEDGELILR